MLLHARWGRRRISAWSRDERFFGNTDPTGKIADGDESAGEEESDDGDDADYGNVPAIGLGKSGTNTGDLTADDGADEGSTHGWRGGRNNGAAF